MKFQVALIASLLAAAPAFAQDSRAGIDHGPTSAPGDTRHTGDTNDQGERLICRNVSTSSTSRMAARRACHTEAEWREIQRRSEDL